MAANEIVDREAISREFGRAGQRFHQLLDAATDDDLDRPSKGTRWTNE